MENRLLIKPIISGIISIIAILLSVSLILSLILHLSATHAASVEWFLFPITLVTLFIGGVIAGYKSGTKGWYYGGLTGISFVLLIWLISFLGFDVSLSIKNSLFYISYVLLALIGGIVGVNMSPHRKD